MNACAPKAGRREAQEAGNVEAFRRGGVLTGPTVVRHCPISACTWLHTEEPLPADLSVVPGFGSVPLAQLAADVHRRTAATTERVLEAHLKEHTVVEWAREVADLRAQLARAQQEES